MDQILLSGLVGIGTAVAGYLIGKKKENAEIKVTEATAHGTELDATEKAVAIWRNLAQDLKKEVDELRGLIADLRAENEKLRIEVEHLNIKLAEFLN